MKKTMLACWALACIFTLSAPAPFEASAQEMPAPRRMPRTPVSRQTLESPHEAAPASRSLQGPAMIFDGEKLRIGETDLRLFGIVPPQLAASFGPQARTALDNLANGQSVSCQIRDRDRDGRLLATCHASNGNDMALELLKRGLAVTARGSITGTDVATAYLAAEQAAQLQKIGLWSTTTPAPVSLTPVATAPTPAPAPAPVAHVETPPPPAPVVVAKTDKPATPPAPSVSETQNKIAADIVDQRAQARIDDANGWEQETSVGFFERYQILIAGLLMLSTALSIIGAIWAQKARDKRDEAKAVAAALRGELMAARSICLGRSKSITNDDEDQASVWPRIRATLYQAYVGRLGLLGAELARQISSIYGQSSDYAALYNSSGPAHDASKKHALETLARHIDEVLPKLANVEQTGTIPLPRPAGSSYQRLQQRPHDDEPTTPFLRTSSPHILQASYKPVSTTRIQPASPRTEPAQTKPSAPIIENKQPPAPPEEQPAEISTFFQPDEIVATPEPQATVTTTPPPAAKSENGIKPAVLWEIVRGFIQNHRNAIMQEPVSDYDHVSEYAAMIEADMARYPYNADGHETLNRNPKKTRH